MPSSQVMQQERRALYPEIEPYNTGMLPVSSLHTIYYEESGNPHGMPVVFLHGGPGGGTVPRQRQFFDPARYRIILFDQRGCGRSRPYAELRENTTWELVGDLERLRNHLEIERWQVFGGSWGSTLALAYAQSHPRRVLALVLRGIFLLRRSELLWFYQDGASAVFPDAWAEFVAQIPEDERSDLIRAYYKRLTSGDPVVQQAAARAWSIWEASTSFLRQRPEFIAAAGEDNFAVAFARIEAHYFVHHGFLEREQQLLENIGRIRQVPAVIVQGRYDVVCPMYSAWQLHRAWPEAELVIVPDAGHSAFEPGIQSALIDATDRFSLL